MRFLGVEVLAKHGVGAEPPTNAWLEQYGFKHDPDSTWWKLVLSKNEREYEIFFTDSGNWLMWERKDDTYEWEGIACIKSDTKFEAYMFLLGNKFIDFTQGVYE